MTVDPVYNVYAVRYARTDRISRQRFLDGEGGETLVPMDYFVWAIVGERHTFVVDTGFDANAAMRRSRTLVRPVAEGLADLGIDHAAVREVIITHLHYDHAGNTDLFGSARFHLQDREMQYATGRHMAHAALRHPYELEDTLETVRRVYGGRVRFHDGDAEIAPGISLHLLGGHARGLQAVRVSTSRGYVVLASDAAHFYDNYEQRRAFPVLCDLDQVLEGFDTLTELASSPDHVIPGHDPLVLERYAPPRPELAGRVAQLDRPPVRGSER